MYIESYVGLEDNDLYRDDLYKLAEDPNTSPEALTYLADHQDWWVRCLVFDNPSTPIEIHKKLSNNDWYSWWCGW